MNWIENIFILGVLIGVATAIVHLAFAFGVFKDSQELYGDLETETWLVPGAMWAFATLVGGIFVAAIYWFIHRSTLNPRSVVKSSFTLKS